MKKSKEKKTKSNKLIYSTFSIPKTGKDIVIIVILISVIGIYLISKDYSPKSTIKWEIISGVSNPQENLCSHSDQLYPPTTTKWPFPTYSPNQKYYVEIDDTKFFRSKLLRFYRADNNQEIGRYYSELPNLIVDCWAEDSSGVYISDYDPGTRSLFVPFSRGSKIGPVKKLLVP